MPTHLILWLHFLGLRIGNPTYAAITAVISANVVLAAYIISSVSEDKGEAPDSIRKATMETKKQQ